MPIIITIPGEPIAHPRAKVTAFAGRARMYTPTKNGIAEYKALIRLEARRVYSGAAIDSAVQVDCEFIFSRPKSHFRTGKHAGRLRDDAPRWHDKKPDRDNCDKAVLDALKGVVLQDDCRVASGSIIKRFVARDENPGTIISISVL